MLRYRERSDSGDQRTGRVSGPVYLDLLQDLTEGGGEGRGGRWSKPVTESIPTHNELGVSWSRPERKSIPSHSESWGRWSRPEVGSIPSHREPGGGGSRTESGSIPGHGEPRDIGLDLSVNISQVTLSPDQVV